jgi:hypothetical protein
MHDDDNYPRPLLIPIILASAFVGGVLCAIGCAVGALVLGGN